MVKLFTGIVDYIGTHQQEYVDALKTHLFFFITVLLLNMAIGITCGVIIAKKDKFSSLIINIFSFLKMIPSLALLLLFIPIIGIGFLPAFIALTLHALPTILINTYAGFRQIDVFILESAKAMGMSRREILFKVEFPLAMPLIFTGIRTSSVDIIATTTIAAYIGAGGLGQFVIMGLVFMNSSVMMAGSLTIAAIVLIIDLILYFFQRRFTRYLPD